MEQGQWTIDKILWLPHQSKTIQSLFLTPLAKRGPHKPVGEMGCLKRSLFYMADEAYKSFVLALCSNSTQCGLTAQRSNF